MTETTLVVPEIACEHCERAIVDALSPQDGVRAVAVDIPSKQVRVAFDENQISIERMKEILAGEDYPVASAS